MKRIVLKWGFLNINIIKCESYTLKENTDHWILDIKGRIYENKIYDMQLIITKSRIAGMSFREYNP